MRYMASPLRLAFIAFLASSLVFVFFIAYTLYEPGRMEAARERQTMEMAERGAILFSTYCWQCHGISGKGAPAPPERPVVLAPNLREGRTDFKPQTEQEKEKAAEEIYKVIARGRRVMPPWSQEEGGALMDSQIRNLVVLLQYGTSNDWELMEKHVREQLAAQPPGPTPTPTPVLRPITFPEGGLEAKGLALFLSDKGRCFACHAVQGVEKAKGTIGPELTKISSMPYRGLPNDPEYLEKWLKDPAAAKRDVVGSEPLGGVSTMPNYNLTDEEVETLVALLKTFK